jgi:hypothetical protein
MNLQEFVRFYRGLRLCVVPAIYRGKRPEIDWKKYQTRQPTDEELETWFNDGRAHNIAIVCGEVSDNLVVLDFDDVNVYQRFFDTSKLESSTLVVRTGSGKRHVYFKTPKPIASFRIPQIKLEVRSTGNIVIAPPSLHPSGNRYEFMNPEIQEIATIKDLPEVIWTIAESRFGVQKPSFAPKEAGGFGEKLRVEKPGRGEHPPCIRELLEGVDQGFRNEAACRLASYFLFTRDLEPSKVRRRLLVWNRLNRPPLPEREIESVLTSIYHRGYVWGCHGLAAFCERESCLLIREKNPDPWAPKYWRF